MTQNLSPGAGSTGALKRPTKTEPGLPNISAYFNSTAPETATGGTFARDRAAVATTAIIQIVGTALVEWFNRDQPDLAAARAEIETILRDEFFDIARQVRDEIRLAD
jgi:hypothetical protein